MKFTAAAVETKTVFGALEGTSYPTLWTGGQVKISLNLASPFSAAVTPSADQMTADFTAGIADDGTAPYTFYSISPADAGVSLNGKFKSWTIDIPASQTPTATSVDEKAQILAAKTEALAEFPSQVTMSYRHVTAYGKLTLTNLPADVSVVSVDLVAAKNWAGRYYYYVEDNSNGNAAGTLSENTVSSVINVVTASASDIWFACAPVDMGGETLKIKVNTDNGIFEKTITFPAGRRFEAGKVAKFTVDMAGVTPVVGAYDDADGNTEADWVIAAIEGDNLRILAEENTTASVRTAYIRITATNANGSETKTIAVNQAGQGVVPFSITASPANIATSITYGRYENADWIMTCGSNNNTLGCNSNGASSKMMLGDNYGVAIPFNSSVTASTSLWAAIISKAKLPGIVKVELAGTMPAGMKVYSLLPRAFPCISNEVRNLQSTMQSTLAASAAVPECQRDFCKKNRSNSAWSRVKREASSDARPYRDFCVGKSR